MTRCILFFTAVVTLLLTMLAGGFAQGPVADAKGLVVYKDPQTNYVEVFEFLNSEQVNAYTTRYTLAGGLTQQVNKSGMVVSVTYPGRGTPLPSTAQIQADLGTLDGLAKQYPKYTSLLNAASTRLRSSLAASEPKKLTAPPSGTNGATPVFTLSLKDGTNFREARIIRVGTESLTIVHSSGMAEVSFLQLPDDLADLPAQVKSAVLQARKAQSQAAPVAKGGTPTAKQSSPGSAIAIPSDILSRRDGAVAIMHDKLAHDVESTKAELDRVSKQVGELKSTADDGSAPRLLSFRVERKLDAEKFGSHFLTGSKIYQIQLPPNSGAGSAILWTEETQFSSSGPGEMYVKLLETLSVHLENGFDKETSVFKEVPKADVAAWNAKQEPERKLRAELSEAKQKADAAAKHQQLFDYATKKFSSFPLGPVCHVSNRLQVLGFRAQIASAQWNKILALIAQADWQNLADEVNGTHSEITSEAQVDATLKRLLKTPVTVAIKSDQTHLIDDGHGSSARYLERPQNHRIVSVAALAMPANAEDLLNGSMKDQGGRMRNAVDISNLPSLENLRSDLLPDKNGFVTKWNPSDTGLYFCVDIMFHNPGERSASSEMDVLRRAVQTECVNIKRKRDLGEVSDAATPEELRRSLNRLFEFANGPLMNDF